MIYYFKTKFEFGDLIGRITSDGKLSGLWFDGQKYFPVIHSDVVWLTIKKNISDNDDAFVPESVVAIYRKTIKELAEYAEGYRTIFTVPICFEGTSFQKSVWDYLNTIPYGETRTYGEIGKSVARQMGKSSMSAQAVGQAVGHNPISVIIPCHRVVSAKGQLTGYAGGIDKKRALLAHEQQITE